MECGIGGHVLECGAAAPLWKATETTASSKYELKRVLF
jgi:hypothetical protein